MCRSIKTLRPPYADDVTAEDVEAAALQYVRKVVGMSQPSARNQAAFAQAVQAVAAATRTLLEKVTISAPTGGGEGGFGQPINDTGFSRVVQQARKR